MKWQRALYQPVLPLGKDGRRITGSKEHIALSRQAAAEGMVLLKNENHLLPFKTGTKIAVFGKASIDYVKGGGGSGDVTVAYTRNLYEGLKIKESEGKVSVFDRLSAFYQADVAAQYAAGAEPGLTREPEIPDDLLRSAKAFTDTAIITICRFSGEGWDRKTAAEAGRIFRNEEPIAKKSEAVFPKGDFYLTDEEEAMVKTVTENFSNVAIVLNVGGMADTSWFQSDRAVSSVLLAWQAGIEGGLAAADILCGDVNPSGKLTDTFAASFDDYPSSYNFHESDDYVEYTDDIFVGYRYFETIPGAAEKVNYPFGFGLSYTSFSIHAEQVWEAEQTIYARVSVTNTGDRAGKEVIQMYYSAPAGALDKPSRELAAYKKTRLLQSGETQILELSFPVSQMASYDDTGKVQKSAYVLEPGSYHFHIGNSVRNTVTASFTYEVSELTVIRQLTQKCAPYKLSKRLKADGTYETLTVREYPKKETVLEPLTGIKDEFYLPEIVGSERLHISTLHPSGSSVIRLQDVADGKAALDELLEQLTDLELVRLTGGQPNLGVANTWGMGNLPKYGIPNVMTEDGPAGVRINKECGVCTTAWPCATLLACTWNLPLIEEIGSAGALEILENNISIWLTPAVNIHRSPLCGRNFEYYSEDPLVSGKSGAAMVRGIQSKHVAASVKHFFCNNKETNRKASDSIVSERALREIYLKAFEIIVHEADPWTIMSSYNIVNGTQTSENKEVLTDILRGEWNYQGMVTTDWWNLAEHYKEIKAGNDVKMACGYPERILEAMKKGAITREEITVCAKRILEMILKLD